MEEGGLLYVQHGAREGFCGLLGATCTTAVTLVQAVVSED